MLTLTKEKILCFSPAICELHVFFGASPFEIRGVKMLSCCPVFGWQTDLSLLRVAIRPVMPWRILGQRAAAAVWGSPSPSTLHHPSHVYYLHGLPLFTITLSSLLSLKNILLQLFPNSHLYSVLSCSSDAEENWKQHYLASCSHHLFLYSSSSPDLYWAEGNKNLFSFCQPLLSLSLPSCSAVDTEKQLGFFSLQQTF